MISFAVIRQLAKVVLEGKTMIVGLYEVSCVANYM